MAKSCQQGMKHWYLFPLVLLKVNYKYSTAQTKILTPTAESAMPGIEIGINYFRAAFKYDSDANIDLRRLGEIMPGCNISQHSN